MTQDEDPVFEHPKSYGIDDLESPGEPNRADLPPVLPIAGTGQSAREEHQRRHHERGQTPSDSDYRDRRDREDREQAVHDVWEAEEVEGP